jgi:Tol biopolymer transport system component
MSPVWLPDGSLLFVSDREGGRDVYWVRLGADGRPGSDPMRITTGLNVHTFSVSADGSAMAYSRFEPRTNIWTLDLPSEGQVSARAAVRVTAGNQIIEGIAVTADGHWLAFDSNRSGNQDIYTMELPQGEPVQLTTSPTHEFLTSWSWDGAWLSGHTIRGGFRHPFLLSADGTRFELVSERRRHERFAALAPDGRRVVFDVAEDGGVRDVVVAERDESGHWGEPRIVTRGGGNAAVWSPDGHKILCLGIDDVRLVDPDTGDSTQLVAPNYDGWFPRHVTWGPDGRTAYYSAVEDASGQVAFWGVPAAGGTPTMRVLFDDRDHAPSRLTFATDGRRFYFSLPEHESDIWVLRLRPVRGH